MGRLIMLGDVIVDVDAVRGVQADGEWVYIQLQVGDKAGEVSTALDIEQVWNRINGVEPGPAMVSVEGTLDWNGRWRAVLRWRRGSSASGEVNTHEFETASEAVFALAKSLRAREEREAAEAASSAQEPPQDPGPG